MAIKTPATLSKEDFNAALVTLRSNVSEVSRDTGIPRHLLSHFRNYGDGLKPEQIAKLLDYLEDKGIELEEIPGEPPDSPKTPIPPLAGVQVTRYLFPVDADVSPEVMASALDMLEEADARLAVLMKTGVQRNDGFLDDGDLADESKQALQEAFGLLAANYIVIRMLRGWRAFNLQPVAEMPQNIRDVIYTTFEAHLVDAGLIAPRTEDEKEPA